MTIPISSEHALQLLFALKRIRGVEEAIAARYPEGHMRCPTHLCIGQEAVAAGVGAALRKADFAISTHRSHGHYLAKGGDLKRMIAEIHGKSTGCSSGRGGSMHLIDESAGFKGSTSIVGGTIPVGTGLGLSIKLQGTDQVSCVFLGDGAVEEGVFYESINMAAVKKLPILYICENNLYSVYTSLGPRQPAGRKIHEMVTAMGVPGFPGDGNDVLDVYTKAQKAVQSIRTGGGPVLLEFATYRWREHCGPHYDNNIGYRTEQEFLAWQEKDPVATWEQRVQGEGWITAQGIQDMNDSIAQEIKGAFEFADASPFPPASEAGLNVFAT